MIAADHREDRARALNILHGIYGGGAAISPVLAFHDRGRVAKRGIRRAWHQR